MSEQLHARVQVIETKFDHLDAAIRDLAKVVREMANQPKQLAWREIAATASVVLGLCWYIGTYLEAQHAKNVAVDKYRIEQLEKQVRLIAPIAGALVLGQQKSQ